MTAAPDLLTDHAQGDRAVAPSTTGGPATRAVSWRGYTPDTTDDEARRLFLARFGELPATVLRSKNLVLAGPVPTARGDRGGLDGVNAGPAIEPIDGASTGLTLAPLTGLLSESSPPRRRATEAPLNPEATGHEGRLNR